MFTISVSFASDANNAQLADVDDLNFTQLQKDIDKSGTVADLEKNYVCEDNFKSSGVNISRDLTVNGHNFTVNAVNKSTIFNITSANVNFRDISFVDSQNAVVANGQSSLLFENCRFINAGINFTGVNLTFKNCEFTKNSFVNADGNTINITGSQFHDLRISDNGLSLNTSNIIFKGNSFENNIAYRLSGDTIYTGGFATLINVSRGNVEFSNNRFKNNTLQYLIYSVNNTNALIDDFTVEYTDFSAYKITNNIKKDIDGDGLIFAGNFTNLEIKNAKFRNIEGSRSSSLININLTGNFSVKNTEFLNLSCPFGLIEIYDKYTNPMKGNVVFDRCTFKNIDSEYNMSCYDWDNVKGEYIWKYGHGSGYGIAINYGFDLSYWQFWGAYYYGVQLNKDISLTNIHLDNVEGGGYFFDFTSQNLNITNFTAVNSKIGRACYNPYFDCYGLVLNGFAAGNMTVRDVLQDNITALDYSIISYNSTFDKYLYEDYYSGFGGAGFKIGAKGNMDAYNITIKNSEGSYEGIFLQAGENSRIDKVLVFNVTGCDVVSLDKYYPDLDLQTFKYYGKDTAGGCYFQSYSDLNVSNVILEKLCMGCPGGHYSGVFFIDAINAIVENITIDDFIFDSYYGGVSISGDNTTVKHMSMNNSKAYSIKNESSYDENLGKYIWSYSAQQYSPVIKIGGSLSSSNVTEISDINITNCEMGADDLFYVTGNIVDIDSLIIENISAGRQVSISYDRDLNEYIYNGESYSGYYEGVFTCYSYSYLNVTNVVLSSVVTTGMGNVAYISHDGSNTDAYMNFVNITVSNIIPLNNNVTYYDKNLGKYITTRDMLDEGNAFEIGTRYGVVNFDNFNVENVNGVPSIFSIGGKSVYINNSTFKNISAYDYEIAFDNQRDQYVYTDTNQGRFMKISIEDDLIVTNSTFQDMNFSNYYYGDVSGIFVSESPLNYFSVLTVEDSKFINCTVDKEYEKTYDSSTGEYETKWADFNGGSSIVVKDFSRYEIAYDEFINCSAIKGGALSIFNEQYSNANIINSNFTANKAEFGGAVYLDIPYTTLSGLSFANNSANQGGALCSYGARTITDDVHFINNTGFLGGAIYYASEEDYLYDCEFRYNKADMGSAIFVNNILYADSTTFLDNQAKSSSLEGSLNVTNDGLDVVAVFTGQDNLINAIYAVSDVKLTNVTYWTSSGVVNSDIAHPNKTVSEDGINITLELYNSKFKLNKTVNITNVKGEARFTLPKLENGRYFFVLKHEEDTYYSEIIKNDIIQIGLLNSPIDLKAEDIFYLENATVSVSLGDATGNVTFEIDGKNITTKKLTDGFASLNVSGLAGGVHNVTVYYSGDDNYLVNSTKATFTVKQISSFITVKTNGGDYKSDIQVNVTVSSNVTGRIIVVIEDEFGQTLTLNDTYDLQVIINSLDAGQYNITAYYSGDNNYVPSSNQTILIVNPIELNPTVSATNVTVMENTTFNLILPDDFTGKANITVDGISKIYDIAGSTQLTFVNLTGGNKSACVKFFADTNYNNIRVYPVNFTVVDYIPPVEIPAMNITVEDITYLENATAYISLSSRINGTVRVYVGDKNFTGNITNGTGTVKLYGLNAGIKTAIANFTGEGINITSSTKFNVAMAQSKINIASQESDVIANVTPGASGNVTFYINGREYTVDLIGNSAVLKNNLTIRNNSVIAFYNGDANYLPSRVSDNFIINKTAALVNVAAAEITYGNDAVIIVHVGSGQKGHVTIEVANKEYSAEIMDGGAEFTVSGLNATSYEVTVTYSGDANFTSKTNKTTLTVNKANSTAGVTALNVTDEDNTSFIINNVPENFKGKVNITVDGFTYSGEVKPFIKMTKLSVGDKNANVTFYGDSNYNDLNLTVPFTVSKASEGRITVVTVIVSDVTYPGNATAYIVVSGNANGTVVVSVNGKEYPVENVVEGFASIKLDKLSAGIKNVTAKFTVSDSINNNTTGITKFNVNKANSTVDIFFADANVTVKVNPGETGRLVVYVNGIPYEYIYNGTLTIENALIIGENSVIAVYDGSENYTGSQSSKNTTIPKKESSVNVTADNVAYGSQAIIVVNVPIAQTGHVAIFVDGKNYTSLISDGKATFNITGLKVGEYDVSVSYEGNANFTSQVNKTSFNVVKANMTATVIAQNITTLDNSSFVVSVPDDFTGKVNITVDNLSYSGDVMPLIVMGNLSEGVKTAEVSFFDDANYNGLSLNVTFKVVLVDLFNITTIKADNMTRGYNSEFDYQATFLDRDGSALANVTVKFIVNGKEYDATTNDDGIAHLTSARLAVGTYKVTSLNPVTGEKVNNTVKIVKRITENKNLVMDYHDGSKFKVKVFGDDGNIAPEGEIISFYVNGIFYVGKVDKTGHASVKIKLLPKKYTIVAEYKGFKTTNKLTVKQILKPVKKKITIKKSSKSFKLKAILKYSNGKALKGKKITFKIKGKIYKAKTNKKGIATVKVKKNLIKKLKKGKKYKVVVAYTVKEKYGNDIVPISDKVKCYVKVKK